MSIYRDFRPRSSHLPALGSVQFIYRSFEHSYHNELGQPQVGLLEVSGPGVYSLDTFKLKKLNHELHLQQFPSQDHYMDTLLQQFSEPPCEQLQFRYLNEDEFFRLRAEDRTQKYAINLPIRALERESLQPYVGIIWVDGSKNLERGKLMESLLDLTLPLRNHPMKKEDMFYLLADKIAYMFPDEDFALGMHVARRGGISFQAVGLRHEKADISQYIFRSTIE